MNNNYNIGMKGNFLNKNATTQMIFDNNEINKFILQNNVIEHNSILFKYNNTLVVVQVKTSYQITALKKFVLFMMILVIS